jgi:four helix bundle protein
MKPELQTRLVKFSAGIIWLAKDLKQCFAVKHLYSQIVRSATSAALNYGEAQTAESSKDFIHKLCIVLKELKETEVNLEIIIESKIFKQESPVIISLTECRELIAIFTATIKTMRKKSRD